MASDPDPSRDLMRGSLDLMVLAVLADDDAHGYAIQKRLAQVSGVDLPAGTLYPLLHRIESQKLVKATWDHATKRPRKRYALTAAGRRRLQADGAAWKAAVARLDELVTAALATS